MVGDQHCQHMASNRFLSHWDLHGYLPYHRYHFAGGRDHVQQNLSRITTITSKQFPNDAKPEAVLPMLLQSHQRYMDEKPPLDGHRSNVLSPPHTHVGIGLAVVGQEFTMSEEFINRYVKLSELPLALQNGPIRIDGEMIDKNVGPYYCVMFYEGTPQKRTREELEKTYTYSDTEGDQVATVKPWEMSFDTSSGKFHFTVKPNNLGPGLYHLLLWVKKDVRSIPYTLSPGANKVDTSLAIPAAGWVFRK